MRLPEIDGATFVSQLHLSMAFSAKVILATAASDISIPADLRASVDGVYFKSTPATELSALAKNLVFATS
jgi:DNA-binding NarL/FixJ family response regulator